MTEGGDDFAAEVGGARLPFCAMNAAGAALSAEELRALACSRAGAVVMRTATLHPLVHPDFRSLHNPGFDKLVPLARELVGLGGRPIVASIAGGTVEECALLARAFGEAGVVAVEAHLGEPWVNVTLAPFDDLELLRELAGRMVAASPVPLWVRLPDRPLPYGRVLGVLAAAGVRAVGVRNDFTQFEKLLLERAAFPLDVVPIGNIASGFDVRRALAKGARAVQVGPTLGPEGARIFARLEREMRRARGPR